MPPPEAVVRSEACGIDKVARKRQRQKVEFLKVSLDLHPVHLEIPAPKISDARQVCIFLHADQARTNR